MCSQGGGVLVYDGTATFTNCEIFENTVNYVRCSPPPPYSMAPMEEVSKN